MAPSAELLDRNFLDRRIRLCRQGNKPETSIRKVRSMAITWRMNSIDVRKTVLAIVPLLAFVSVSLLPSGSVIAAQQKAETQTVFASPEEAMKTLVEAAKAKDRAALGEIFGPSSLQQLLSGDPVQDDREMDQFAAAVEKSAKLERVNDAKFTLTIGERNWPFPIPIVKEESRWRFDTRAGADEILNRRIGENELSAILTVRAYVLAQWQYFTEADADKDGVAEYAQKFISSPGKRDGLYWDTVEGEKPSPLGSLVGAARAEGYGRKSDSSAPKRAPYHGYYFKILTRQGAHAPGGKYSYIINGIMIAGHALVAYPDKWGSSGVMTFIVNQQGRVYQKNLGPKTAEIANAMTEYNPDPSWQLVKE
ncbi:MAG TPA: DUF2950 domain-containing protein [Candidatus Binatia bacterium]